MNSIITAKEELRFFFLTVLEFELRASHLLDRYSTVSSPFCCGYFGDKVSLFAWTMILLFKFPPIAEMTGMHYNIQLFLLRWGLVTFAQDDFESAS
jgi:hypothetical protein